MRDDDETVDLFIAAIGEREHRPVVARRLAAAHLNAADDAVGAGRGRNLDAVVFGVRAFERFGEIDGRRVKTHAHRIHGLRARCKKHDAGGKRYERGSNTQR